VQKIKVLLMNNFSPKDLMDHFQVASYDESPPHEAMPWVLEGKSRMEKGAFGDALGCFNKALAIVLRFPHAVIETRKLSVIYYGQARLSLQKGEVERSLWLAVTAVEADPENSDARNLVAEIDSLNPRRDTTKTCYVFYDAKRAEKIHREAILRCLEFISISGVIGDIMEFGVLAGWSARIFAETMRDLMVMGNLRLFDSFDGLPDYDSEIDQKSFEISGRNIWSDKMRFSEDFVSAASGSLDEQIKNNLSYVIRDDRIKVHRGFYKNTLQQRLPTKAALIHMDCDLYQSASEVLWGLFRNECIQDGCVVMFDDWNCNKANPNFGEKRAFQEFLKKQKRFTASQFFTYGFNGAAFILHERAAQ
jgi:hypothetical protein